MVQPQACSHLPMCPQSPHPHLPSLQHCPPPHCPTPRALLQLLELPENSQPQSGSSTGMCLGLPHHRPVSERASHQSLHLSGSVHAACLSALDLGLPLSPGSAQPMGAKWLLRATSRSLLCLPRPSPAWHVCSACLEACMQGCSFVPKKESSVH